MSFADAIIYRQTEIDESINTAWVLNIFRGLLLFLLLFALAPLVASFYEEDTLKPAIQVLGIVFIFEGFYNLNMVLFRKRIEFKQIATLNLISDILGIIVVIILAYYLRNVWALISGLLFSSVIKMVLSFYIAEKRPKLAFNSRLAWELFHYSKYLTGAGMLVFLTTRLDDGLVGKLLSMEQLGFYINAYFFANLPATHITSILGPLIFPSYARYNQDQEKLNRIFLRVLKVVAIVTIPASFGLLALSDEIATVLLGPIWTPMTPALKILIFFGLFRAVSSSTGPLFKAMGKPKILFWLLFWKLLLIAIIIYPLISYYGIVGAAVAVTIPMALEQVYLWKLSSRLTGIPVLTILKQLIMPILLAAIMYGLLISLKSILPLTSIPLFFLYVLFGIMIYGAGVYIFDRSLIHEIKSLKDINKNSDTSSQ